MSYVVLTTFRSAKGIIVGLGFNKEDIDRIGD